MTPIDTEGLAALIARRRVSGHTLVVAMTGAVAAGKSTLAQAMAAALDAAEVTAEVVCTDGFLFPNAVLEARGLNLRKGFPESYDTAAMAVALAGIRRGAAAFPGYSHVTYDIDPGLSRMIERPDVLIVEGLGFPPGRALYDLMIYLDAEETDLEAWFTGRFMRLWRAAEHDPTSFYARFRVMDEPQAALFAAQVWANINLPNLRENIVKARETADILVRKAPGHAMALVRGPQ